MLRILRRVGRLTRIAVSGGSAIQVILLYAVILSLQFVGVWFSVKLIEWNKAFYDALENRNIDDVVTQIAQFALLIGVLSLATLASDWLRKRLYLKLRQRLTDCCQTAWLSGKAFWHLRPGYASESLDNPEQRISEDCRLFIERLLIETLDLISSSVALVSYVGVLWSLSTVPLDLSFIGLDIAIPRYMVWVSFIYAVIAVLFAYFLGKPLKNLYFHRERREADFRYALIQIREGADEIAQASGELAEAKRLNTRFEQIRQNWFRVSNAEFVLGLFVTPYFRTVLRVPLFIALPAYFIGNLTLGGAMQLASAFSQVTTTLSWFIFNYKDLAEFVAVSERLERLIDVSKAPPVIKGAIKKIDRTTCASSGLVLRNLDLLQPNGFKVCNVPDLKLTLGEVLWVNGSSGVGKSTLLSAITGLWPYGCGVIEVPTDNMMALPQTPRVFPEGLAYAACYPRDPEDVGMAKIVSAVNAVGLQHRGDQLVGPDTTGTAGLSLGERQRLAMARILISKPDILILDEATSALDFKSETELYRTIRAAIPNATIICAAHRPPDALGVDRVLELRKSDDPDERSREPELVLAE